MIIRKILIVDDSPTERHVLSNILVKNGYQVEIAESGEACLAQTKVEIPDLILMDVNLPNLDGIHITKLIRDFPFKNIKKMPIIGITANASQESLDQCAKAGMNKVLVKPFEKEELLNTVFKILK